MSLTTAPVSAAFLFSCCLFTLHALHMFQLNSYKIGIQLRWLAGHRRGWLGRNVLLLPLLLIFRLNSQIAPGAMFVCFSGQALAQFLYARSHPAKKPLVYTNRVKRLLTTHAVLLSALAFLPPSFANAGGDGAASFLAVWGLWLAFLHMLTPFFILLANIVNSPLEKWINNRYVDDARRLLRDHPKLLVLGVTGSYGKTSTKFFLHKLLSMKYNVLMTPENYNTTLGVVRAVRENLKPWHEIFICEMGARNVGDIKEICDLVKPAHGVITSIGPQHLESFRSLENVVRTKFELADALPEGGAAFLNLNNACIRAERNRRADSGPKMKSVACGFSEDCDYRAHDVGVSAGGSSFFVTMPDGENLAFETALIGRHNVENIVMAVAAADFLGVGRNDIVIGVRRLEPVPHRLQLIRSGRDILIDDAYNSNVTGAKAALDALALFDGRKILVTPGMVELGSRQDELAGQFGAQAAEVCDFVILIGKLQTENILSGLKKAGYPEDKIYVEDTLAAGLARVASLNTDGERKIVLLENDLPDNY
ncbi:MAG: UDP-N-acetylmuramoyl-tripeptide--D-alanyl-D-alanine ligase [Synergistaceae bacterium]|jgi:UDP-N-acetylmuramoyl-tripeptide--D-alanyl-D-alanine ligase|nr:UDP-N-acetylmuramoyl-tripeptide--D-alanyl-D-alanine ligase [Synergistaceae bacterium]